MTTVEYLHTPETLLPRELAFGVLRVADAPIVRHQRVVRDLTIALTACAREHRLGEVLPAPVDVILDRDANLVVQPDLVVEVLSPHPRIGRLHEKVFSGSDRVASTLLPELRLTPTDLFGYL